MPPLNLPDSEDPMLKQLMKSSSRIRLLSQNINILKGANLEVRRAKIEAMRAGVNEKRRILQIAHYVISEGDDFSFTQLMK